MKRRTTALVLTLVLALSQMACDPSAINILIATFDPATVPLMRLPAAESVCAEEVFSQTGGALRAYKADPTADKWQAVRNAAAQFNVRQCSQNADFVAIVQYGQRILDSVEAPRARGEGVASAEPDFDKVDKDAVKELKKKVDELKRK